MQTESHSGASSTPPRPLSPSDPTPRYRWIRVDDVRVKDDAYSGRIRCDHPRPVDPARLGRRLLALAKERGRSRVVMFVRPEVGEVLLAYGYVLEARIPGYYQGQEDCWVLGHFLDDARRSCARSSDIETVRNLISVPPPAKKREPVTTRRATEDDAEAIATLIDDVFEQYPTPSGMPAYVRDQIREGTPFRVVEDGGEIVACACADLVRKARTAELTDCATRPDHRGRGLMQFLLKDLMGDLVDMGFPTVFTLARAAEPGVNLGFLRLGFSLRGLMTRSCRIGSGLEDIHVWSRRLIL